MIWGVAGPWYGPFMEPDPRVPACGPDHIYRQLAALRRWDLECTGMGLRAFAAMPDAQRGALAARLEEDGLRLTAYVGFDYQAADADTARREADACADLLARHAAAMRCPLCITTPASGHRFDRAASPQEKMERLAVAIAPLAEAVHDAGLPLGIENHGDFYVDELARVCAAVPHLGLFLDTGNTYLIGERPLPAYEAGAPYVVGGHFKDHRVRPMHEARPLHFEVDGSALGDGDADLRACWDLLMAHAPDAAALVMELEMVAPEGGDPVAAMERSLAFVRSLPGAGLP